MGVRNDKTLVVLEKIFFRQAGLPTEGRTFASWRPACGRQALRELLFYFASAAADELIFLNVRCGGRISIFLAQRRRDAKRDLI